MLLWTLLSLIAGLSAASFSDKTKPLLDDLENLPVLLQKSRGSKSLAEGLGVPESAELTELEIKIRRELGAHIRRFLDDVIVQVDDFNDAAQPTLGELAAAISSGTPSAKVAADFVATVSSLQKQRDSLGSIVELGLHENNLQTLTWYAIEARGISDWWQSIKDWFSGIGSWISDKFDVFKEWAKDVFFTVIDAAKPIVEQIKDLAVEFLKNNWDTMSIELVKQAMNFFVPFSGVIGEKVMTMLIELARNKGWIPWENLLYLL